MKSARITVSIVGGDEPSRCILSGWIRRAAGLKCVGVHQNAESALVSLPRENPSVVLLDITVPDLSGIECVRRLKPRMPDTQFVMMTVCEDADHIFTALASGATGYLLKGTSRPQLLAAVKDVHRGGAPMSSSVARKVVRSFQRFHEAFPSCPQNLSPRERQVLQLLVRGLLYKEIADALRLGIPTINTHIQRLYEKLRVRSRAEAIAKLASIPAV